jgi:hypothetical protein
VKGVSGGAFLTDGERRRGSVRARHHAARGVGGCGDCGSGRLAPNQERWARAASK